MTTTSRPLSATPPDGQELAIAIRALDLAAAARARLAVRSTEYACARATEALLTEQVLELVRRQNQRFR